MSQEAAQAWVERVANDEDLRNQLIAAGDEETRLRMAKDEGFDVTAEDVAEIRRQYKVDELSEDDLAKIAGGGTTTDVIASVSLGVGPFVSIAAAVAV